MKNAQTRSCNVFRRTPLEQVDGIPVFSVRDRYVINYERIASDHLAAIRQGQENPFMEAQLWRELEDSTRCLIDKYGTEGCRILDVGVGLGRLLEGYPHLDRHGIDISFEYLTKARDKGISVAYSRIEDMPYEPETFDIVVACDVLEHVLDLHLCCRRILKVLRPGGVVIVRVPFKEELDSYLGEDSPYEFVHLRNFDLPSLKLLFSKIFECEYLEHQFTAPYYGSASRAAIRLPESDSELFAIKDRVPKCHHALSLLHRLCAVSQEEFLAWLYDLRTREPVAYERVVSEVVLPLEINAVFRKDGRIA